MFMGSYDPKMDEKGRVILPARFRDDLEGGVVLTRGQEHCIYCFPVAEFEAMTLDMRKAPLASKQARDWTRLMLSSAYKEVPDKQGRITIPATLRKYASLNKELTVIGVGSRAEIWDTTAWEEYLNIQEDAYANTSEEIIPGSF